jgi:Bacteriophage related domain of unknown function
MPSLAVINAVRDHQAAGWTTLPVYYPNDMAVPATDGTPFVQVEFPIGAASRVTLARDGVHEEAGTIRFIVHVRLKTGSDAAFGYAEELAALFRSIDLLRAPDASLETFAPTPPHGLGADVAYYLVSTSVPYSYLFVP